MKHLQGTSTIKLVFLSIITFGVFEAFYVDKQTKVINQTSTQIDISGRLTSLIKNLSYLLVASSLFRVFSVIIGNYQIIIFSLATLQILSTVFGTTVLIWSFLTKDRINQYLNETGNSEKRVNGVWTLIFSAFYINYFINRLNNS